MMKNIGLVFLILVCATAANTADKTDSFADFRFSAVNENSLGLWEGAKPLLVYNHGTITNPSARGSTPRSCYVHPLYGLDGEVLTDDFPKDHDYHRGLYWAWPHIKIREQEYDLWSIRGIEQKFQRWITREISSDEAILTVENGWFVADKRVMQETVSFRVHRAGAQSRAIDLELTWKPIDDPITLSGAPGKSYGGLNLRFASRSKPVIIVPAGRAPEDLVVTKFAWADLSEEFKQPGQMSGAAIFVDPDDPDFPPTWMTRHYGLLSVGWPGVNAQTFPPGKSFTCRYRVWIHRKLLEAEEIQKAYEEYRRK
jgi:hypothetical protein